MVLFPFTLYQWAQNSIGRKIFITTSTEQIDHGQFFDRCKQAYSSLNQLRPGEMVIYPTVDPLKSLIFLMAVCQRKGIFVPIYEGARDWEINRIKSKLLPHYQLSSKGILIPLHQIKEALPLDAGVIFQTSGQSGPSRFVYQSEKSLIDNALRAKNQQHIGPHSRTFSSLSLSHSGGLNMQILPTFLARGEIIFLQGKFRSLFKKIIAKSFTHGVLTPYGLRTMINLPSWKNVNFNNELTILTGSSPVAESLYYHAKAASMHLLGVYGMTEIGPMVSVIEEKEVHSYRKNKFPLGRCLEGFSLNLSNPGNEILIKGPCTGSYILGWKKDWEIISCGNPFVYSGDSGIKQQNGLYYQGRIKREINFDGVKINPEEVEEVLKSHHNIKNAFVYGEECPIRGEVPCVKIVPQGEQFNLAEIKKFMAKHFDKLKNPRKYELVEYLELTSIGKVKSA